MWRCGGTCSSVSMSKMRSARRSALVYLLLAGFSRPALKAMLPWSFSSPAVQPVFAQQDRLESLFGGGGGEGGGGGGGGKACSSLSC